MSNLGNFIKETGDAATDLIKTEIKNMIRSAKSDTNDIVKETGSLLEDWLIKRAKGKYDDKELKRLVEARKLEVEQQLNTIEIQGRAKVEGLFNKLTDLLANGIINALF